MSIYNPIEVYPREYDEITECQNNCEFECGTVGYCLEECGENYIINTILDEKGYTQANIDWGRIGIQEDETTVVYKTVPAIEIYRRQARKFIDNMKKLGYNCSQYDHPDGKRYLTSIIIEHGINPITIAHVLLKLEVVK